MRHITHLVVIRHSYLCDRESLLVLLQKCTPCETEAAALVVSSLCYFCKVPQMKAYGAEVECIRPGPGRLIA